LVADEKEPSRKAVLILYGGGMMKTAFMLMAQYDGQAIISLELVCRDYFTHLTPEMLLRKVGAGQIKLPITRMETSQKSAKGVHISDLCEYLDARRAAAVKETNQLHSVAGRC
jgi:hypothetical protein